MKKIFTILILLFSFNSNAQFNEAESGMFAKYKKGKVYDKNGNSIEGLIKKRNLGGIKFKLDTSDNDSIKHYDYKHISGFEIFEKYRNIKYEYKKIENKSFYLMKVERKGIVSLYSITGEVKSASGMSGGMTHTDYYIEKNEKTIKIDRKFNKSIDEFFDDCPRVIEKIKNEKYGEIKKIGKGGNKIRQIVDSYNRCMKNGV